MKLKTCNIVLLIVTLSISLLFAAPTPKLIAIDKFIDNKNGWAVSHEAYIKNGSYNIHSESVHKYSYLRYDLPDGKLGVMTKWQQGSIKTGYGLIFRVQDGTRFYYFLIVAGGYFSFGYFDGTTIKRIVNWQKSTLINSQGKNYLEIDYKGNRFIGYINGKKAFTQTDSKYKSGGFGFLVSKTIHIQFDDLMIWKY